jgi:hypothetical protein
LAVLVNVVLAGVVQFGVMFHRLILPLHTDAITSGPAGGAASTVLAGSRLKYVDDVVACSTDRVAEPSVERRSA